MDSWIQSSDFESTEINNISLEQAKKLFMEYDWSAEINRSDLIEEETCPAGLGLVSENKAILHICPKDEGECFVNYHYPVRKKLLGIIPLTLTKTHYIDSVSFQEAEQLIDFHFTNLTEKILEK